SSRRALDLPKLKAPPRPPPCIWRMKNTHTPMSRSIGNQDTKMLISSDGSSRCLPDTWTPAFIRSLTIQRSPGEVREYGRPVCGVTYSTSPCTSTLRMRPSRASSMNWVYETVSVVGPRPSNCLKTVNSTSAMTIHTATFEKVLLFKLDLLLE